MGLGPVKGTEGGNNAPQKIQENHALIVLSEGANNIAMDGVDQASQGVRMQGELSMRGRSVTHLGQGARFGKNVPIMPSTPGETHGKRFDYDVLKLVAG